MNQRNNITVLQLEGTTELPSLEQLHLLTAGGPEEAFRLLCAQNPDLLVMQGEIPWHTEFASSLCSERRPATLVLGNVHASAALADEWLGKAAPLNADEVWERIALARTRALARRKALRRAYVDLLTGLPNRRALVRGLLRETQRARRYGTPLSLALIDLDGFKQVNDREGHPAGDRLLRKAGLALRRTTRANELCGRLGGDEFAIVLSGDASQAFQAAQRSAQALTAAGAPCTFAVCELNPHENLKALYRRTDVELQAAKARKKGLVPVGNGAMPPPVVLSAERPRRLKG